MNPTLKTWEEWVAYWGDMYPCSHPRTPENSYSHRGKLWRCRECTLRSNSKSNPRVRKYRQRPDVMAANSKRVCRYNKELRMQMVSAYGGGCTCCGESRYEFLTLEHVGGGGNAERMLYGGGRNSGSGGMRILYRLRREGWPKGKYTVYCANCNMATKYGSVCPHQG